MNRTRSLLKVLLSIAAIAVFALLSKPDLGGVNRCSTVFAIPTVKKPGLLHKPFITWEFFESPKFRFAIPKESYPQLAAELALQGYSEWTRGGLTFESVDIGWQDSEDHIFCELAKNGYHHHWSYSAKENLIYAITFPE